MFFPLYTGVAPPIYVPTTSFKLMTLRNIRVEEALLSKDASVTMKQISHPVQSRKVKRKKTLKCNYALYEAVDQPSWSLFNTNMNAKYTMFSSRNRRNCDCKDFPLKFFHKKALP